MVRVFYLLSFGGGIVTWIGKRCEKDWCEEHKRVRSWISLLE